MSTLRLTILEYQLVQLLALLNNKASLWRYERNDLYQNLVIQSIPGALLF